MSLSHSLRASLCLLAPFLILLLQLVQVVQSTDSATFEEIHLTQDNFDEHTNGKTVFLKMYAPWCGHCQEIAPDWEKMAKEWTDHKRALVASVDCTKEEDWCVAMGITGFPSLLFGDPSQGGVFLLPFSGDKTYEGLSQFAKDTLTKPVCSAGNPSLCDKATKKKLKKMWKQSIEDLESSIKKKEQSIAQAEKDFQSSFEVMQAAYDKESQGNEIRKSEIRNNVKLLRTLMRKESS